jgi:hypothetical protein
MATTEQVMVAIETRLQTISGLRTDTGSSAQINPPQALVGLPDIPNYHATFAHGRILPSYEVTILVSNAYTRTADLLLAAYVDPSGTKSIHAAVEGDPTLGGVVQNCIVEGFRKVTREEFGLIGYYGGIFTLKVIAAGT